MDGKDYREEIGIAGSGKIDGGDYAEISISGSGRVTGDAEADRVFVAGSGLFEGSLDAEEVTVTGKCKVKGPLTAETVTVRGSLEVGERLRTEELRSYGVLKVDGDLLAKSTYFAGSSSVTGNLESDTFTSRGGFEVEGLLTADEIEIWLGTENYAEEVGGEEIEVVKRGVSEKVDREKVERGVESLERSLEGIGDKIGFDLEFDERKISEGVSRITEKVDSYVTRLGGGVLRSSVIEGDNVDLEGVEADTVRGNTLVIGKDCVVEKVEYSEDLEVKDGAEVGERIRT